MTRHEWVWLGSILDRLSKPLPKRSGLPDVSKHRANLDDRYGDLPMIQHLPIPTPAGHPDLDTFDSDMAKLARLGREVWSRALNGARGIELGPTIWDSLRIGSHQLQTAIDAAEFDCIADDIERWKAESR